MGDFAKAFGGYTETAFGWVDNSPADKQSNHTYIPDPDLAVVDWGDRESVFLRTICAASPSIAYGEYTVSKSIRGRSYSLSKGVHFHMEIPNGKDFITPCRNENGSLGWQISRDLPAVLDSLISYTLEKGLFAGAKPCEVSKFLHDLPFRIKPNLQIGADYLGEDYAPHIEQLSKMALDSQTYVSDIVAILIYKDPKGCLNRGADAVVAQARAIKAQLG